ncbi:ABC transporter substrate-binding protein [Microlunatus soli]|uniref:Carbohydrate ABC transporter substrate-binding protein, CUT1 family n=1 Tax=Microlunatus soli TaxID=630515 RepID=A0A1H1W808_9ACTN|nr:sugar ABC transporter substrate-binding protein [Microlunatus soli]SDS93102.1 carbohydrate ABC transporter substrate-binding protein, CUT1 family [Microlunatus soli]
MRLKQVGAVVAALSLGAALVACGPNTNGNSGSGKASSSSAFSKTLSGDLKTYGYNPSDEVGKSRSDYATGELKGVKVTMDTSNFDTQKFAAQAAAGQVPDLIQADRNVIATLADKKLIMPMDQCYALWGVKPTDRYYPSTIADVTYQGHVYAVPQFFQASALLVDKRVLKKAGVSLDQLDTSKPDQLVAAAKRMTKAEGGKPTVIGFAPDVPGSTSTWFTVFGGRINDGSGKPTLDDPKNVKALSWLKKLTDAQGGYAKNKSLLDSMDVFGAKNQYVKDQVGVQVWAQWYVNVLAEYKSDVDIEAVPIKTLDGKTLAMAGGSALAIPTKSGNPSAACAWAIKVASPEAWQQASDARQQTVTKTKAINTGLFTGSPVADQANRKQYVKPSGDADFDQVINTYYDILPQNRSTGSSAVGQSITDSLNNAVIVALSGDKTPQQALAQAQSAAMRAWDQSNAGKKG